MPKFISSLQSAIAYHAGAGRDIAMIAAAEAPLSYRELHEQVLRFAEQLADAGLDRNDPVGVVVPPGLIGGRLLVAVASNVTLVPINPSLTEDEVRALIRLNGARGVIIPQWLDCTASAAVASLDVIVLNAVRSADDSLDLAPAAPQMAAPASPALRPVAEDDILMMLRSSGTSGPPKLIPVTNRNMVAMAQRLGSEYWFGLSELDRAVCTLPLFYAAGLKTSLFVPLILGASVGFPPEKKEYNLVDWANDLKPTYLSLAPPALNIILDRLEGHEAFPSIRFVMSAASYLPASLRERAERAFGVPIIEYYALSEAGVMAANPVSSGMRKPGTVGLPAPSELKIADESGATLPDGAVGRIMITGPTVMPGYIQPQAAAASDYVGGWLRTGDLGKIDEEGYLTLVGRETEVINRGGEKVFPYEIESAIQQHPAVLNAAVFSLPHPRLGESVAVGVVLKPDKDLTRLELARFLEARLAPFKRPSSVMFVSTLPKGPTGKVLRSAMRAEFASQQAEHMSPDRVIEYELLEIWRRLLESSEIGVEQDFLEAGGDSLLAAEMLVEVEELYGRPYPASELSFLTVRHMAEVMASDLEDESELWTQVGSGSKPPLFFCHGDYFTRGIFARRLASLLPEDQPVCLLHPPKLDEVMNIEDIAGAYLDHVLRVASGKPVVVAGYCNGGLVAWRLTELLRARGQNVSHLLLIETPSLNARPGLRALAHGINLLGGIIPGALGRIVHNDAMRAAWHRTRGLLSLRKLLSKSFGERAKPGVTLGMAEQDPGFVMTYRIMSRYIPRWLDVPVTAFIAQGGSQSDTDPRYWAAHTRSASAIFLPGTHQTIIVSERAALAGAITQVLLPSEREAPPEVIRRQTQPVS